MTENEKIKLRINGMEIEAPKGVSVLRAAEINGIYIPTLCYHKNLSTYGGCRLCIVEIEGMRGFPLSCSTIAGDGMNVLTDTAAIQETRRELLQLIMSEHPSSCLICSEAEECRKFMKTVRKAGVSSGCRYCPNDDQCELQDVIESVGVKEIAYPVLYRNHEAERKDPFFDRDYNLCILCGRCVRMCQEMRGTGILAFNYRGPQAQVGTAFGRDHIEAGCEFCGSCITVCPTGTLYEKVSKWDGKADDSIISTCPYCAIGCQLEMFCKNGQFSKAVPTDDPEVNDGQACVKGRFCMAEVSHHFNRARKPFAQVGNYWKEITWDEALDQVSDKLKDVKPGEFAMLISPDCTNESLYVAQKFVRTVMKTNSIDSSAREDLGGGLPFWMHLFRKPISINNIKKASRILAIGLDTRFNFSIVGVEIRKALQNGAQLVSINSRESNIAKYSQAWIRTKPASEGAVLLAFEKALHGDMSVYKKVKKELSIDDDAFMQALEILKDYKDLTVVFGPRIFKYSDTSDLTEAILSLSEKQNVSVVPLYYGTNTRGAVDLGVFPEILPGATLIGDKKWMEILESQWKAKIPSDEGITIDQIITGKVKPKVLYLVGAAPFLKRPDCEYLIVQDIFESDFKADIFLPASSFLEASGTLVNMEGRVQQAPQIEIIPDSVMYGRTRPDWWIFSELAKKLDAAGFEFLSDSDVLNEISVCADGFPSAGKITRARDTFDPGAIVPPERKDKKKEKIKADKELVLIMQPAGYTYRGFDLRPKVEGLMIIEPEEGFFMNTKTAMDNGITAGEKITIKADGLSGSGIVKTGDDIPPGVIYLYSPQGFGGLEQYKEMADLFRLEKNPCPVEVTKYGV